MFYRTAAAVVAAAALAIGLAGSADAAGGRPTSLLHWAPCPDAPAVQCAPISVPIDWQHSGGPQVSLALARRPATDPSHRIGSLLIGPGGPGGSGVQFVQEGTGMFSATLLARFDIVSWDPRGVGASHPVTCDPELMQQPFSLYPQNQADVTALADYHRRLMGSCRAATGPLFDHLDTASSAHDLEAIRAALGEDRLTFYAMSYGTLTGELYAQLYPHRVRAIALDSTEDHAVGALGYVTMLSQAQEQSYAQFAAWCRATSWCPLQPRDPWAVLDELYQRAEQGTITVPGAPERVIDPDLLLGFVRGQLMGIGKWLNLATNLRDVLAEPVGPSRPPAPVEPLTADEVTKTAIMCEDHAWPVSTFDDLRMLSQAMHAVAPHTHLSTTGFKDVTGCLGWPRPVPDPQRPLDVRGAPSILVVNSRYDVATPYPGALHAFRQLGAGATLLTYDGTSHADYQETTCVGDAIDAYLISPTRPRDALHCPAVFPVTGRWQEIPQAARGADRLSPA